MNKPLFLQSPLAPYAVTEYNSRGRQHPVSLAKDRNAFQRDYTRILHSRSFRKLQGKTQVFPAEMGDVRDTYRTRMSHSFEVEQVTRSCARQLGLNQDLCAALAIAHDIGHAPFGHMGQDVLNELFKSSGGFEHNHHALRLVDVVESPYPNHSGLNLMFETREGLLKHCTRERAQKLGLVAQRHLNGTSPPLEVQLVDAADQVAYLHGDLEDAIDKNLFTPGFLMENMPGFSYFWAQVVEAYPGAKLPSAADLSDPVKSIQAKAILGEVWRRMLSDAIDDLIVTSRSNIELEQVGSLDDVRAARPLIALSEEKAKLHRDLRRFSREWIYNNPKVMPDREREREALTMLYHDVQSSPQKWGLKPNYGVDDLRDFLAGLTDRSVMEWYWSIKNQPQRKNDDVKPL